MNLSIEKFDDFIRVEGHYDDPIKCAKLTLLCKLFGTTYSKGHAILPNTPMVAKGLSLLDDEEMLFVDGELVEGPSSGNGGIADSNINALQSISSIKVGSKTYLIKDASSELTAANVEACWTGGINFDVDIAENAHADSIIKL